MFALVGAVVAFLAAFGVAGDGDEIKWALAALGLLCLQVAFDGAWAWHRGRRGSG